MIVQLGDLVLPDTAVRGWLFSSLTDWYSLSGVKAPVNERPQSHGAFGVSKGFRASAAVSFTAHYLAESEDELLGAFDDILAVANSGVVPLRVTDARGTTERMVSVRATDVEDYRGRTSASIDVDCLARDPRRYSVDDSWLETFPPTESSGLVWPVVWPATWADEGSSSGRIELVNRGVIESAPTYRLHGGFSTALLTDVDSARRIGLDYAVRQGSFVEIDFARRTAVIDGQSDVSRYLVHREWWTVGARSSVRTQFDVTKAIGEPRLQGKVRSAW